MKLRSAVIKRGTAREGSRELRALSQGVVLHCGTTCSRPSACTRWSAAMEPPHEPPPRWLRECTRDELVAELGRRRRLHEPLVIDVRDVEAADMEALCSEWEAYMSRHDQERMFTATTPSTEGVLKSLSEVWAGGGLAIQHDLAESPSAANPIIDFLDTHRHLTLYEVWSSLEQWVKRNLGAIARYPAFVNGVGGKPTLTHFDDYDSVAIVLSGLKTFYVAPPPDLLNGGCRRPNESDARPHKHGTRRTQRVAQPFTRLVVRAGSVLCLPAGWWHYVESDPHTLMLCAWTTGEE